MIARIWHGVTHKSKADDYLKFVRRTAIPDYKSVQGNKGVFILRRMDGDKAHFLTFTLWDSTESIRKFAGEDITKAKYYPEDREFLLEFEPTVTHYEAYESVGDPG
jgi:heme-degrading monooxygenase HmoA